MPREIITVQVGQCGNQIGTCFWDLLLKEHSDIAQNGDFDDAGSTYFRRADTRLTKQSESVSRNGYHGENVELRARAVLVDTEEGVLNRTLSSPLRKLFDETNVVKSGVSGAGNNFCHGFFEYGKKYGNQISNSIRCEAEKCDSMQAFFMLHSAGGGTGSGLGSCILSRLADEYPKKIRLTATTFPSHDDDVITSPYNASLATSRLVEYADAVFSMDNKALMDICSTVHARAAKNQIVASVATRVKRNDVNKRSISASDRGRKNRVTAPFRSAKTACKIPYDDMNSISAHMLSNLTSCSRFHGKLNVDISELTTNLVPFPGLHFLMSGLSPICIFSTDKSKSINGHFAAPSQVDQAFREALSRENQLMKYDPCGGYLLGCAVLVRGNVNLTDMNRNIEDMSRRLDFLQWNYKTAFKIGHCAVSPPKHAHSVLLISNSTCMTNLFADMESRFRRLYGPKRKAYVHHYTQYAEESELDNALENLRTLQSKYTDARKSHSLMKRVEIL